MFAERLAQGKVGESAIASWLRQRHGYHILPVYEVSGGQGQCCTRRMGVG
jgi:hypothetical protein